LNLLLRGLERADIDLYEYFSPELWPRLSQMGAPLQWGQLPIGGACLRRLLARDVSWSSERDLEKVLRSLSDAGVDLGRHHFCCGPDDCGCGYFRHDAALTAALLSFGKAIPCGRSAT
jgi:hypothetical protein